MAAVALATSTGGPAGVALLVGITAGIAANSATKNVSLTAVGRFVATRAAAMATNPITEEVADLPEADGLDGADSDALDTAVHGPPRGHRLDAIGSPNVCLGTVDRDGLGAVVLPTSASTDSGSGSCERKITR